VAGRQAGGAVEGNGGGGGWAISSKLFMLPLLPFPAPSSIYGTGILCMNIAAFMLRALRVLRLFYLRLARGRRCCAAASRRNAATATTARCCWLHRAAQTRQARRALLLP